jgi:NADH-quinone oxidoreductase subunit I
MKLPGTGLLKGMAVTAKNLIGSYYDPNRLTTMQYPEERAKMVEQFRSYPFLVFDGTDSLDGMRCVACKICEKECPTQCIYIVQDRDEKGKLIKRPKIFDIDISVCMGCGLCVEACPFDSIRMDQVYETTARDRFGALLLHREQLLKSNEYYHRIHPSEAAEVDAAREAERKKKEAAAAKKAAPKSAAAEEEAVPA